MEVTTNSERAYVYRRLQSLNAATRFIEVQPGFKSDPIIRCQIAEGDTWAPYEAVSYTWGDASKRVAIECFDENDIRGSERRILRVTQNCYNVLRKMRKASSIRRIWIDAISINQSDLDERSAQVRHMSGIYRHAKRLIIDLGEPPESMIFLKLTLMLQNGLPVKRLRRPLAAKLAAVFESKWFTRVWILQETAFGGYAGKLDNGPEVLIGDHSISWKTLTLLFDLCGDLLQSKTASVVKNVLSLRPCFQYKSGSLFASSKLVGTSELLKFDTRAVVERPIWELVASFWSTAMAADARDKVIALIAFSTHSSLLTNILPYYDQDLFVLLDRVAAFTFFSSVCQYGLLYSLPQNPFEFSDFFKPVDKCLQILETAGSDTLAKHVSMYERTGFVSSETTSERLFGHFVTRCFILSTINTKFLTPSGDLSPPYSVQEIIDAWSQTRKAQLYIDVPSIDCEAMLKIGSYLEDRKWLDKTRIFHDFLMTGARTYRIGIIRRSGRGLHPDVGSAYHLLLVENYFVGSRRSDLGTTAITSTLANDSPTTHNVAKDQLTETPEGKILDEEADKDLRPWIASILKEEAAKQYVEARKFERGTTVSDSES